MSRSQFYSIKLFILRHAWLNLWDKHMTTGRINQVTSLSAPASHSRRNRRQNAHTKGTKRSQGVIEVKNSNEFCCTTEAGCLSLVSLFFHCITHRTKQQRNFAQGKHAASRRIMLDADCSHRNQALPKGSGCDAVDLQISPDYVYQSGKHTDSFFLSANSHWASQMFEPKTRSNEWNWVRALSFYLLQLNTQLDVVFWVCTRQLFPTILSELLTFEPAFSHILLPPPVDSGGFHVHKKIVFFQD